MAYCAGNMTQRAAIGCALILISVATAEAQTGQPDASLLARGDYLVNAVMGCDGCHTPRNASGFVMGRRLSGGPQTWDTPEYTVKGSNISGDKETGIGDWSAEEIKRLVVDGVRPSGVVVSPQMPYPFYKILTPRDLDAVAAYIKTAAPVRNEVQLPVYKTEMHVDIFPGGEKPMDETALQSDPMKRGFYLATIAHCI